MEEKILKSLDIIDIQQYQQNKHPLLFIDYVERGYRR